MNKVVCNLCGTSYPENAAQCPICGYARSADLSADSGSGTYNYVKGGRFSKANVKKRNQAAGISRDSAVAAQLNPAGKKRGSGLTIVVIILLLAIVAVLGYITLRFFLPNNYIFEGLGNLKLPGSSQEQEYVPEDTEAVQNEEVVTEPVETEPDLSCTDLILEQNQIEFTAIGEEFLLQVEVKPADTDDPLTFTSSDTSVATVSNTGVIKSVGEGSTTVTVTCGEISVQCSVTCSVPTEPVQTIELNRKEITFDVEGQSWILYNGDVPVADIVWSSDNNEVATIEAGKVVAVGNGDTTVHATYEGTTVSCIIHCRLDDENSGESGSITEASGDIKKNCKLYNPYGFADDVTLKVDESFTLRLVDEYLNIITDAEWSVEDPEICSFEDSKVTALKIGQTTVCAKYGGVTYECVVRVI